MAGQAALVSLCALSTLAAGLTQRTVTVPNHCDSLPAQPCLSLWPSGAPNETHIPPTPNETRTPDDGHGCGISRSMPCDHIHDVSEPTLTPFVVSNGSGAAVIIAPGGGYHNLAFTKEGLDVARMYNAIGQCAPSPNVHGTCLQASLRLYSSIVCQRGRSFPGSRNGGPRCRTHSVRSGWSGARPSSLG